jgi:hypothetical protein
MLVCIIRFRHIFQSNYILIVKKSSVAELTIMHLSSNAETYRKNLKNKNEVTTSKLTKDPTEGPTKKETKGPV